MKLDKCKYAPSSGLTLERKSAREGLLELSYSARPVPSTSAANQVYRVSSNLVVLNQIDLLLIGRQRLITDSFISEVKTTTTTKVESPTIEAEVKTTTTTKIESPAIEAQALYSINRSSVLWGGEQAAMRLYFVCKS